jgi:cation diffusion facilitator family transporter
MVVYERVKSVARVAAREYREQPFAIQAAMTLDSATQSRRHDHVFDEGNPLAERSTLNATLLTAVMMVAEVVGGYVFNSMALLADGWHMVSHALALGMSVMAYILARRHARDSRFVFGTWKIEILGAYTSAIFLVLIAGLMLFQSVSRIIAPSPIMYDDAIVVTLVGLLVNFICAWMLRGGSEHGHDHGEGAHDHHHDMNLRSAYLHVVADAATSVLAVVALVAGKYYGVKWMDPVMGVLGAILVLAWAYGLLRDTGRVLLNAEENASLAKEIREAIDASPNKAVITDMHLWRVGKDKYSCILCVATHTNATPDHYRGLLQIHEELAHIIVEVNRVEG